MATKTASTRMEGLLGSYDLQTPLFDKALVDITDKDAHNRMNTKANHVAWLAGSLVQQRFELAEMLGVKPDRLPAANELFKDMQGIKDELTYPSLEVYKKDWEYISPITREVLATVKDEKLDSIFDMGEVKFPFYDMVLYSIYREANCIGQLALYRRLLGYKAINYM